MMSENIIFVSNVAIVQSQGTYCLVPPVISVQDLPESYGTVTLPVVQSESIIRDEFSDLKLLFGSWIIGGDEETQLDEIYVTRLDRSRSFDE